MIEIITVVKDDLEGFLETQKSLKSQLSQEFHWTVIDSTATEIIANAIDFSVSKSLKYVWVEPKGIYSAMNQGLSKSKNEWIWYLNAADVFTNPEVILKVNAIIAQNPGTYSLGLTVHHIDQSNYLWGVSYPWVERVNETDSLLANINHQGFVAKRICLVEAGNFDESLRHVADTKIMDWVATHKGILCLNYHAVNFMVGGHSNRNLKSSLAEMRKIRPIRLSANQKIFDNFLLLKNLARMYASSHSNP